MGRKLKYGVKTVVFQKRVPESIIKDVEEAIEKIMQNFKETTFRFDIDEKTLEIRDKRDVKGVVWTDESNLIDANAFEKINQRIEVTKNNPDVMKVITDFCNKVSNNCDCSLNEKGWLKRGKIKCTKSKEEHKF